MTSTLWRTFASFVHRGVTACMYYSIIKNVFWLIQVSDQKTGDVIFYLI